MLNALPGRPQVTGAVARLILCEAFLLRLGLNSLLSDAFTLVNAYLVCNT